MVSILAHRKPLGAGVLEGRDCPCEWGATTLRVSVLACWAPLLCSLVAWLLGSTRSSNSLPSFLYILTYRVYICTVVLPICTSLFLLAVQPYCIYIQGFYI
jgi:hypothetical protein